MFALRELSLAQLPLGRSITLCALTSGGSYEKVDVRIGCSATGLGAMSLVGTYKFVGIYRELNGRPEPQPETPPHGYLVITPKVYVLFFTAR